MAMDSIDAVLDVYAPRGLTSREWALCRDAVLAAVRSCTPRNCLHARVPLGAVLAASGLRTARTVADLLPYCPTPDPEQLTALLRALADVEPREPA